MLPVAILAGGLATRLRPRTDSIPKALVEIAGEPFLAHQLRLLRRSSIQQVTLCVGYRGEQIQQYAGDGRSFDLHINYSFDGPQLLGTAGALRRALPLLGEAFFVLYGDSYLPCDLHPIERAFLTSRKLGLMTVFHNKNQWDRSNVEFSGGEILDYNKSGPNDHMRHIDYGLGAFHRAVFETPLCDTPCDLAAVYQGLLQRGELAAFEASERFYEIGSPEGIHLLEEYLRAKETQEGHIP
jgi:NDP-sugar pyrophosphorylase family protein